MIIRWTLLTVISLSWCATGQTRAVQAHFEAATIKHSTPQSGALTEPLAGALSLLHDPGLMPIRMPDPGRVKIRNLSLLGLVAMAYSIPIAQVHGPGWMAEGGFDVDATVPANTERAHVRPMLQSLLEERFGLVVHWESKVASGYALQVGKGGPKLTPSAPAEPSAGQDKQKDPRAALRRRAMDLRASGVGRDLPLGASLSWFPGVDAGRLATIISRFVQAPVVDETGLEGTYDVTLETSPDDGGASTFGSVAKLGLRLVKTQVPVEILIVDRALKTPTPN